MLFSPLVSQARAAQKAEQTVYYTPSTLGMRKD